MHPYRKQPTALCNLFPWRRLFFFFNRYSFAQWVCFPRFFPRIWVDISASAPAKPNRVPQGLGPAIASGIIVTRSNAHSQSGRRKSLPRPGCVRGRQWRWDERSLTEASTTVPACLYQATVSPLSNLLLFSLLLITFQHSSSIVFDSSTGKQTALIVSL